MPKCGKLSKEELVWDLLELQKCLLLNVIGSKMFDHSTYLSDHSYKSMCLICISRRSLCAPQFPCPLGGGLLPVVVYLRGCSRAGRSTASGAWVQLLTPTLNFLVTLGKLFMLSVKPQSPLYNENK